MRHPAGVRDIPSGNFVCEVDIRLERMKRSNSRIISSAPAPMVVSSTLHPCWLNHSPASAPSSPSSLAARPLGRRRGLSPACFAVDLKNAPKSDPFLNESFFRRVGNVPLQLRKG